MGIGENFQVVSNSRPSPTFQGKKDLPKRPESGKIESDGISKKPTEDSKPNDDAGTASPKSIESAAHDAAGTFGTTPGHDASFAERRDRIAKTQENLKNWAEKNGLLKTASAIPKKNYSGKFILRTGAPLHKALAIRAYKEGKSLNEVCVETLQHTH